MKPLMFACAQSISLDARTGNASLFHVIDQVTCAVFPSVLPPFTVYGMLQKEFGDAEEATLVLKITQDGEVLSENKLIANFQGKARAHIAGEMVGLMAARAGGIRFTLMHGQKELCGWTVVISAP